MNIAKNKKSIFINLLEVLGKFDISERELIVKFLRTKRPNSKQLKLCEKVFQLIDDGETSDSIDEIKFKKNYKVFEESTNQSNTIQKLITNLYDRVLIFLACEYKKDNWKQWQIKANETLLQIEALFAKELFSQAAALLLKLETGINDRDEYQKWAYDDISIYTRLANLKVALYVREQGLFTIKEEDHILVNILETGYYFYKTKHAIKQDVFEDKKLIGYRMIADYYSEKKEYKKAIDSIDKAILQTKIVYQEDQQANKSFIDFLLQYKQLLAFKMNDKAELSNINNEYFKGKPQNISTAMLFEQSNFELQLSLAIKNDEFSLFAKNGIDELYFYSKNKIDSFELRKEFNLAILLFIEKDYSKCLNIISQIKSNKIIKKKDNYLYLSVLFLELVAYGLNGNRDAENIIRNIKIKLKDKDLEFENIAIKALKRWSVGDDYTRRKYSDNNKEEINELNNLLNEANLMHNLIIAVLENRL